LWQVQTNLREMVEHGYKFECEMNLTERAA
jgi:hypothetical protein